MFPFTSERQEIKKDTKAKIVLIDEGRAWAHEAHVTDQHVPELREFIQLCLAQEAPDPGDPWVLVFRQRHTDSVGVDDHGAEFPDAKRSSKLADTGLAIEDGAAIR